MPPWLRHPRATLAVTAVVAVGGLLLAFRLDFCGSTARLVDGDSSAARATADLHREFGGEPITIHVTGKLTGMLLTRDLATLLGLEGCLGGNMPRRAKPLTPCAPSSRAASRSRPSTGRAPS